MPTVTLGSTDYEVYSDLDAADEYLAADFGATAWRDEADEDQKARAKVTAFRLLNTVRWRGEKTDEDQTAAFPRSGMGLDDIDDDEIPQEIIDAENVLAKLIHAGSPVVSSSSSASNIKRQQAGSVSIEYFSPIIIGQPSRWPQEVLDLIRRFFGGTGSAGGSIATGTCGESAFCPDFRVGGPL